MTRSYSAEQFRRGRSSFEHNRVGLHDFSGRAAQKREDRVSELVLLASVFCLGFLWGVS